VTAPSIHRVRRPASALVALLAACSTLAACGGDSSSTAAKKEQPILTEDSVVEVWKDYDRLNNAAMVESGPPSYDGTAYDVVDVGPILENDITSAKVKKVDRAKGSKPFKTSPKDLYAPVESAGFALSTTGEPGHEQGVATLTSIVSTGDPATWKLEMSVDVKPSRLPRPLEPGRKSTASKADVERAREVVTSIHEYWRTERAPTGVALGAAARPDFVNTRADFRKSKYDVSSKVVPQGISTTPGAGEALRVVRAQGGLLVLANVRVRSTMESHEEGTTITLTGPVLPKIFGTKPVQTARLHWNSSLAISVPDEGRPTVVGAFSIPTSKGSVTPPRGR
jgi:hypothetical protein